MLESGILKYIENDQLGKKLQKYYLINCSQYNSRTEFHANFISDHIEGPLLQMLNHKKGFLVNPEEVIEHMEHGKLRSLVNWQISYFDYQLRKSYENINEAEKIIGLIENN